MHVIQPFVDFFIGRKIWFQVVVVWRRTFLESAEVVTVFVFHSACSTSSVSSHTFNYSSLAGE